jgi:NDP-sugar pyrophosphorylase family protein
MQAMVLSAGFGTRLGDLTREIPKPMLDVQGRPLLEYILRHLGWCSFERVSVNLHFLPRVILNHFGSGRSLGLDLSYSHEPELLGTAGGVKKMADQMEDSQEFLIHYGDVLTDQDFGAMLRFHRERGALVTMLLHERARSNSVVGLDDQGRVNLFLERPSEEQRRGISSPWVNSGVWICSSELLGRIPSGIACDLARDILPPLVKSGRILGFPLSGYRCAVDSATRLDEACSAVAEGRCRLRWNEFGEISRSAAA